MEPATLFGHLVNLGGVGILAAVLLYLHLQSIRMFREELKEERDQCHVDHEKIMNAVGSLTKNLTHFIYLHKNSNSSNNRN